MFNDKCVDTDGCEGPMSEEVEVMSAEDIPRSTPTKVGARPFNSTAIRVHWNPVPTKEHDLEPRDRICVRR